MKNDWEKKTKRKAGEEGLRLEVAETMIVGLSTDRKKGDELGRSKNQMNSGAPKTR